MLSRKTENKVPLISTILLVILALLVAAVLVLISGNSPLEAYSTMIWGAFGSKNKISELLVKFIPVLIMAFGVSLAYKAQLWNIGANGQFVMAAIASTTIALYMPGPVFLKMIVSLLVAVIVGALWAGLAGWLKNRFNANEVITTLMLNYVATYFLMFVVTGPSGWLHDPYSDLTQSDAIPQAMHLTRLLGEAYRLHSGIFIALLLIVFMLFFWKTPTGLKINLTGQGEKVATYSGLDVKKNVILTMLISGAFCGLAGWMEIFAIQYRLQSTIADYGNIATIVALLGALNPVGIIIAAAFFSILLCGGSSMQRMTDVPYSVVDVIQGLIIILIITKNSFAKRIGNLVEKKGGRK